MLGLPEKCTISYFKINCSTLSVLTTLTITLSVMVSVRVSISVSVLHRGGSTLGPGGTGPQMLARPPNILVPTAKIRIVKI